MRILFADTGYWVALLNSRDNLHDKALNLSKTVQPAHIVTSEMVLTELLNDFSSRGDHLRGVATKLIHCLTEDPNTTIIPQDTIQFNTALQLYEDRLDKAWSQTDCVSFKLMEERNIVEALAYDKHFAQAGFVALMRNCKIQRG
jgi:uncharacterized protein